MKKTILFILFITVISNVVGIDQGIASFLKEQGIAKVLNNEIDSNNNTENDADKDDIFEKSFDKNLCLAHFLFAQSLVTVPYFSEYLFVFKNPTIEVLVQPPLG